MAGGGDGQCAGTGANTFVTGRAYVNLGTAVVSGSFGKAYAHNPVFRTMTAVAEEGYSYETAIRTGTFLVNWMVEKLFNVECQQEPRHLHDAGAGGKGIAARRRGVMLVPYWLGCMTPYWSPKARGVIAGLSGNHSRGDVYRAVLEGIALEQVMMTDGVAAATQAIDHYCRHGRRGAVGLMVPDRGRCGGP